MSVSSCCNRRHTPLSALGPGVGGNRRHTLLSALGPGVGDGGAGRLGVTRALGCRVSSGGGGQGALWRLFCEGTNPIREGPTLLT